MLAGASPQYSFLLPISCGLQTSSLRLLTTPQLVHSYIPVMTFLLSRAQKMLSIFNFILTQFFRLLAVFNPGSLLRILAFSFAFFAL